MKSIRVLLRGDHAAFTWQLVQAFIKLLISTPLFLLVWLLLLQFLSC